MSTPTPAQSSGAAAAARFAEIFSQEDFVAFAKEFNSNGGLSEELRALMEKLDAALFGLLLSLRDQGLLSKIQKVERRGLRWCDQWNAMVDGDDTFSPEIVEPLTPHVISGSVSACSPSRGEQPEKAYGQLLKSIENAEFRLDHFLSGSCAITGDRVRVQFRQGTWEAVALKRVDGKLLELDPTPAPRMVQMSIPAPTGRMLIADWFRVAGRAFTNAVATPRRPIDTHLDVSNAAVSYAKEHGFLSFFVGGTSPSLYRDHGEAGEGGRMIVANLDEDHPFENSGARKHHLASVDTELWWVSIIDEAVLRDILIKELGHTEGQEKFERFLCTKGAFQRFEIEPGELHASIPLEPGSFKHFDCKNEPLSLQGVHDMHAVLSTKPLEWQLWTERPFDHDLDGAQDNQTMRERQRA